MTEPVTGPVTGPLTGRSTGAGGTGPPDDRELLAAHVAGDPEDRKSVV